MKEAPYWLVAAEELCSGCEHSYAYGTGGRCSACDAELCTVCIEFDSGEMLCFTCNEKEMKKAQRGKKKGKVKSWLRGRSGKV